MISAASHLQKVFLKDQRSEIIQSFARMANEVNFDTLVVTGVSGLLVGPLLAHLYDKQLLVVRKPGDERHSNYEVEGFKGQRLVFVDDLIDAGKTAARVHNRLNLEMGNSWEWAGVFLWGGSNSYEYAPHPWPPSTPIYTSTGKWIASGNR